MDRNKLRAALGDQRAYCEQRSPLYAAVLRALEDDAARQPAWLDRLEESWRGRRFAVAWEAAHLLLACLHFSALRGESSELAAVYPSCGGSGRDPGSAALAFLNRAPADFWERLRLGMVQTNEVGRSVAWMFAAAVTFDHKLPFHLVELGASAGLNLVGDRLPQACRFVWPDGRPADALASCLCALNPLAEDGLSFVLPGRDIERLATGTVFAPRRGAYLSGSIKVGRNCWIAPNCSIRQKLTIGEEAIVGIGAVVVHDVEPGSMVYGNPAKRAREARTHSPTGVLPLHR